MSGLNDQITLVSDTAGTRSFTTSDERRTLRERAISLHCEMVGALVLSRSVAQAAPARSNEIPENVQRDVLAPVSGRPSLPAKPRRSIRQIASSARVLSRPVKMPDHIGESAAHHLRARGSLNSAWTTVRPEHRFRAQWPQPSKPGRTVLRGSSGRLVYLARYASLILIRSARNPRKTRTRNGRSSPCPR
jgi:hypothetical protein